MALESAIFRQKSPHIFRYQPIKISLFANLYTLNNFFLNKTQKQPIMSLWRWTPPFFRQKSPHKFSDTDPSNLNICWFTHFKQLFSLKTEKTTYSTTQKALFAVFQISTNLN